MLIADLVGVAVFAASGGSAGVAKRLDVFGVVFLGCVAALGGGLLRDVIINDFPPLAFGDWRYSAVAAAASLLVFFRVLSAVLTGGAAGCRWQSDVGTSG